MTMTTNKAGTVAVSRREKMGRQTDGEMESHSERHADAMQNTHTDTQTDTHTHGHTQTDTHTDTQRVMMGCHQFLTKAFTQSTARLCLQLSND